jgi:hypothetical protein
MRIFGFPKGPLRIMSARQGEQKNRLDIERRRALVRTYYFKHELTYVAIVERLQARGIVTTRTTVARDIAVLRNEFAAVTRDFDPLVEIAARAERLRTITARAMRSAHVTKDDGARARLLKVAVTSINSEVELLQSCGLLPRDLGTLRVVPQQAERIPSGLELQKIYEGIVVRAEELVSPAELAWAYGDDVATANAAANEAP